MIKMQTKKNNLVRSTAFITRFFMLKVFMKVWRSFMLNCHLPTIKADISLNSVLVEILQFILTTIEIEDPYYVQSSFCFASFI